METVQITRKTDLHSCVFPSHPLLIPSSSLPPIHPTRTINTPLRLLADILPTKLTFDLLLHNIIVRAPRVRKRNNPQRQRNTHKPHNLIQKTAIRKHNGAVIQRLRDGVVPV